MVKRFAAHYIYLSTNRIYKLHYIELNENNELSNIHPLITEIAGTSFYNGILILLKENYTPIQLLNLIKEKKDIYPEKSAFDLLDSIPFQEIKTQDRVHIFSLPGIDLLAAELSTNNSSCSSYIQRLC